MSAPSNAELAKKARSVAQRRARQLKRLERGTLPIRSVLEAPDAAIRGADLWPVLLRVPKLGRAGIEVLCTRAMVWPHRKVGELSEDEVSRLLAHLPERCH